MRAWLASGTNYQHLERAGSRSKASGRELTEVRDELLGDAVILALRLPPEAPADASQARGIVLVRARDPDLLDRMIRVVNMVQQENGELAGVGERKRNGETYHVREFPAASGRPAEWYVVYPDGTFAFSNSEAMIHSVIDRRAAGQGGENDLKQVGAHGDRGLEDLPGLKSVRDKLAGRALARLYVNPRPIERLLASDSRPDERGDARMMPVLTRYLAAVDYAGAALTWNDESIVIHTVETVNPSSLDPWLRRWASDTRRSRSHARTGAANRTGTRHQPCPRPAVLEALSQIVPEKDQIRANKLRDSYSPASYSARTYGPEYCLWSGQASSLTSTLALTRTSPRV